MERMTRIYQCEDSIEGIFTAVYIAWASKYGHDSIRLEAVSNDQPDNMQLFCEYIQVEKDPELATKVARSISRKISNKAYQMVVRAALSDSKEKADCIYHFLVLGFAMGRAVTEHLTNTYVQCIFQMNRRVANDAHYYKEFIRFQELSTKVLFAKIEPECDILELITPHFADRLRQDAFMILDVKRRKATVCNKENQWYITILSKQEMNQLLNMDSDQNKYEHLWKTFFQSIAIKDRENLKLQRNHVPLHYRKYMTEFLLDE